MLCLNTNTITSKFLLLSYFSKIINHLGGNSVVRGWDQEVCSLWGLRFESCGCSYDGHWKLIWSLTLGPVRLVKVRASCPDAHIKLKKQLWDLSVHLLFRFACPNTNDRVYKYWNLKERFGTTTRRSCKRKKENGLMESLTPLKWKFKT